MENQQNRQLETAVLGGGCFWCLEAVFQQVQGVRSVVSGYEGGHVDHPSYRAVCNGDTGHAEVVKVEFDPAVIPYREILDIFFAIHDPTTPDRQGNDVGPQYRSVILFHGPEQKAVAEAVMAEITTAGIWDAPLVTELAPFDRYWAGELEHQDYFARTPWSGYCQVVIAPKVAKFRKLYAARLKRSAA